jgi:KamA family protein
MKSNIETNFDSFAKRIKLSDQEKKERTDSLRESYMPFKVTKHYTKLIESESGLSRFQLLNIVLPPTSPKPFDGRFDPYANAKMRQEDTHYIQHKYPKTMLFHLDDLCFANCQFCYKVGEIRVEEKKEESYKKKLEKVVGYLHQHPEIDNVLLTGGDPRTRPTKQLVDIFDQLSKPESVKVIRFATKGLSFDPKRFQDPDLLGFLGEFNKKNEKRINIIAQYNHPSEIDPESQISLRMLQKSGVQVYGQPAIIRGVNDDIETLTELQNKFLENNIQSYYFIQFMPVKGVEQYGIPLEETFDKVAKSKRRLNGLAKKGVLIAPHDWGKLEMVGFLPSLKNPKRIILKWHQIVTPNYLPQELKDFRAEDLLELKFKPKSLYCFDHVLEHNGLPHIKK